MTTLEAPTAQKSKAPLILGRVLTTLLVLFFLFDAVMKLIKPAVVVEATVKMGYAESSIIPLGLTLLTATLLYLFPKTNILGAILLTGYLGGAIDAQLHTQAGAFPLLFAATLGILVWLALYLRDPHLRTLTPLRTTRTPIQK